MRPDGKGGEFREVSLADLGSVAKALLEAAGDVKVWLLHGEMGAGKTTLVKELCKQLTVSDPIHSPTFSIVNEYETASGSKVYHFDFYRIKNEAEAFDLGAEEYFSSGYPCFIEWPEKIPSLIEGKRAELTIQAVSESRRTIVLELHD
jgi:tRNA threonylcarbamoyladenosine biosynthesis protein TsaE